MGTMGARPPSTPSTPATPSTSWISLIYLPVTIVAMQKYSRWSLAFSIPRLWHQKGSRCKLFNTKIHHTFILMICESKLYISHWILYPSKSQNPWSNWTALYQLSLHRILYNGVRPAYCKVTDWERLLNYPYPPKVPIWTTLKTII